MAYPRPSAAANLNGTNVFYCYDANGNVTELVDTNGTTVAAYVYDPYGNTISKSGTLADANPFRFSTKYLDEESGLYYYGQDSTARILEDGSPVIPFSTKSLWRDSWKRSQCQSVHNCGVHYALFLRICLF
jgi:YD repeat-containing protein